MKHRLRVVGLVDLDKIRAAEALQVKLESKDPILRESYAHAKIFESVSDAGLELTGDIAPQ